MNFGRARSTLGVAMLDSLPRRSAQSIFCMLPSTKRCLMRCSGSRLLLEIACRLVAISLNSQRSHTSVTTIWFHSSNPQLSMKLFRTRKPRNAVLLALGLALSVCSPATAGNIFITGHDPDFHAALGGNAAGAQKIIQQALTFARNGSTAPILYLQTNTNNNALGDHTDSSRASSPVVTQPPTRPAIITSKSLPVSLQTRTCRHSAPSYFPPITAAR